MILKRTGCRIETKFSSSITNTHCHRRVSRREEGEHPLRHGSQPASSQFSPAPPGDMRAFVNIGRHCRINDIQRVFVDSRNSSRQFV